MKHIAKFMLLNGDILPSCIVGLAGVVRHAPEIRIMVVPDASLGDGIDTAVCHFLCQLLCRIRVADPAARKAEKRGQILFAEDIV